MEKVGGIHSSQLGHLITIGLAFALLLGALDIGYPRIESMRPEMKRQDRQGTNWIAVTDTMTHTDVVTGGPELFMAIVPSSV